MLVQLIYCSAARQALTDADLASLLESARYKNAELGITGILLFQDGSFFQVLEGEETTVERLFDRIEKDDRHQRITLIIREPIAERSFADWTMGYVNLTLDETAMLLGVNDFFVNGNSFANLGAGRAKKLMAAFKSGRWRTKISDTDVPTSVNQYLVQASEASSMFPPASAEAPSRNQPFSYAFQPIIDASMRRIYSYEALLRGSNNEPVQRVLQGLSNQDICTLEAQSLPNAIHLAASLGLSTRLNLNILPSTVVHTPLAIPKIVERAENCRILPKQIVLEILESEVIADHRNFMAAIRDHRSSGIRFALDDFGAGYAGLNLLAEFQPHLIKLDLHLIRGVDRKGPRQAIIRGVLRTCFELGIDVIAEGVETAAEFFWLRDEGVELFQGYLFACPAFERLPSSFALPDL